MSDEDLLARISVNPKVMVGKPCIKGTRLTVHYILGLLAHGASFEEILSEYKGLVKEDLQACLLFASKSLESGSAAPGTLDPGQAPPSAKESLYGKWKDKVPPDTDIDAALNEIRNEWLGELEDIADGRPPR
jgi:uncharacterized protein (DUF433 family)